MSGHADYDSFTNFIPTDINIYNVPIIIANKDTLKDYGNIVYDFENTNVINNTWPKHSGRPLDNNTGNQALATEGNFAFYYTQNYAKAHNYSVPNGDYITGIIPQTNIEQSIYNIYIREANYHPDGGQIIFPTNKTPFYLLLSKADDNIKPSDFVAFYCDGTFGIQILPYIWHQPAFPLINNTNFKNKQSSVHGCVTVDTLNEFNTLLCIKNNINIFNNSNEMEYK